MWLRFVYWIELRSRWHKLRELGGSNLVKASVLMPAFGYMLLLNDNVHQYLTIKYDSMLLHYLPAVWRIWLLFYGSFLVAIATLIYSATCPPEIKRFSTGFEMADGECEHHLRLGQEPAVRERLKNHFTGLSGIQKNVIKFEPAYDLPDFMGLQPEARISNMLVHIWVLVNTSRPILRGLIFVLYCVGLALLAIPAAFTFLQVTFLAVKRIVL